MTVERAIELLQQMKEKHGNVDVVFDCPHCGKSNHPTTLVAVALVQSIASSP